MFKTIVKTIIGGALGAVALYAVGRIAYQLGYDMAEIDRKCAESDIFEDEAEPDEDVSESVQSVSDEKSTGDIFEGSDCEREEQSDEGKPVRKVSKLRAIFQAAKAVRHPGKSVSIISEVIRHPEKHKIEAFIDGNDIRVNIKGRTKKKRE